MTDGVSGMLGRIPTGISPICSESIEMLISCELGVSRPSELEKSLRTSLFGLWVNTRVQSWVDALRSLDEKDLTEWGPPQGYCSPSPAFPFPLVCIPSSIRLPATSIWSARFSSSILCIWETTGALVSPTMRSWWVSRDAVECRSIPWLLGLFENQQETATFKISNF